MPDKINKMPEFYTIFARKNSFCPNLGEGAVAPLTSISYAYAVIRMNLLTLVLINLLTT